MGTGVTSSLEAPRPWIQI